MTVLSPQTLSNLLSLIESGESVSDASRGIGLAPGSKSVFGWLSDAEREQTDTFDVVPDPKSKWCIEWNGKLDWLHFHYAKARVDGRANRAMHSPPIRLELEERVAARLEHRIPIVEPSPIEQHLSPEALIERVRARAVVEPPPPAPPRARPSYAIKRAPPLETTNANGPPEEGRFSMCSDRPKSKNERRAGTVEFVPGEGIKQW